jgi:DNA-binding NarL/FixJ family response regulator
MNTTMIRVLVADDHEAYREGLRLLLERTGEIEFVGEAANGKELLELASKLDPDVILTDIGMPVLDGISAILQLTYLKLKARIIAVSMYDSEQKIIEALEAGAFGYIPKNAQRGEIIDAVHTVYNSRPYYSLTTSAQLVKRIAKSKFNPYPPVATGQFSEREKAIIRLICEDLTSNEISDRLRIGQRSIEDIRRGILLKMDVRTPAGIAIYAMKNGLYGKEKEE